MRFKYQSPNRPLGSWIRSVVPLEIVISMDDRELITSKVLSLDQLDRLELKPLEIGYYGDLTYEKILELSQIDGYTRDELIDYGKETVEKYIASDLWNGLKTHKYDLLFSYREEFLPIIREVINSL